MMEKIFQQISKSNIPVIVFALRRHERLQIRHNFNSEIFPIYFFTQINKFTIRANRNILISGSFYQEIGEYVCSNLYHAREDLRKDGKRAIQLGYILDDRVEDFNNTIYKTLINKEPQYLISYDDESPVVSTLMHETTQAWIIPNYEYNELVSETYR